MRPPCGSFAHLSASISNVPSSLPLKTSAGRRQCLAGACSTDAVPWRVRPSDRKWYRDYAVTRLAVEALQGLDLGWPPADFDVAVERARVAASWLAAHSSRLAVLLGPLPVED